MAELDEDASPHRFQEGQASLAGVSQPGGVDVLEVDVAQAVSMLRSEGDRVRPTIRQVARVEAEPYQRRICVSAQPLQLRTGFHGRSGMVMEGRPGAELARPLGQIVQ